MAEPGMAFLNPIAKQQEMDQAEAMAPLLRAHQVSLTRLQTHQAEVGEYNLDAERKAGAMMAQQLGQSGPPDGKLSSQLKGVAQIQAAAGKPFMAQQALTAASTAEGHEATAANMEDLQRTRRVAEGFKILDRATQQLGEVASPEAWNAFNQQFQQITGKPSPWRNLPYSPELVAQIHEGATTMKEKLRASIDERRAAAYEDDVESKKDSREARIALGEAKLRAAEEKRIADRKAGGKDVGAPSSGEVKAADALLAGVGLGPEERAIAAFDVAAQARAKRKDNPGMAADEAMRQVVDEKTKAGDFTTTVTPPREVFGMKIPGTGGDKKAAYKVGGGKPLPLPASGKKEDLVEGKAYTNGKGLVQVWQGGKWTPVGKVKAPTRAPAGVSDDGEDDE